MNDYERIASVIRFLDRHHTDQPDLNALAGAAGLSPFHFHRLFSAWAGVTPKDFLQCLTLEHVKQLLRDGDNVFDAAINAGLSGPGRLHDLCVTLEAASPGEMKSGGTGIQIDFGFADTPFGKALIAESKRGISHLTFVNAEGQTAARDRLASEWPNAKLNRNDSRIAELAATIFNDGRSTSRRPLRAFVRGTPFQVRVWRALLRIPIGALTTYGRLAEAIGQSKAARAVGSAVGANPISFIIPCHRVIRETGALGNYGGGRIRKQVMVGWELSPRTGDVGPMRATAA
jgi:AraC family transcriptional regulator, regulatory protein of adaptative response / methylated-DNA-[protein]-cysteine methyltransferase